MCANRGMRRYAVFAAFLLFIETGEVNAHTKRREHIVASLGRGICNSIFFIRICDEDPI